MNPEKKMQEMYSFSRTGTFSDYNKSLAYYQAVSCIENSKGSSILDLGCGDGTITAVLKQHFKRVVGVDASSVHLSKARKRLPNVEFYESLIEEFEFNEQFDSLCMLNILEHVIDPIRILQKAASFLKDDGILIAHVPNANAINRKIAVLMGTLEDCEELSPFDINIAGHRRSYTLESLKDDINKAGLQILNAGGIFYKMLSTPQMDWFLKNGLWEEGGFGWGRVGDEKSKDWRFEFCRACYEIGKEKPEDCNIIFVVAKKKMMPLNKSTLFKKSVINNINLMKNDTALKGLANIFTRESNIYKYTYNFSWMGRPIIQYPQDILAMQELIWNVKPDLIIETGIAHGGSLIFYASMLELLGGDGTVVGIDIDIREHNRVEIEKHPMFRRIRMIEGSSTDETIVEEVQQIAEGKRVLVCLDSNHTHEHVLRELELYAPFVSEGSYCVVFDTMIEDLPPGSFNDRPWDVGNNPKTAVWEFLKGHEEFVVDKEIENKLLITVAPDGYLKRVR